MWFLFWSACTPPASDRPTLDTATGDTATDDTDTGSECVATVETCNALDDDCDGLVDEEASDASTWYADADGDGWGDDATATVACSGPVERGGDCDDTDALVVTRCGGTVLGEADMVLAGSLVERVFYSANLLDGTETIVTATELTWYREGAISGDAIVGAAQLAVFEYPDPSETVGAPVALGDGTVEPVLVGDLDGDGTDDLLVATWAGTVGVDGGHGWMPIVGSATFSLLPGPISAGGPLPAATWSTELSETVDDATVAARLGPSLAGAGGEELFAAEYMGIHTIDTATGASTERLHTAQHVWSFVADDLDGDGTGDLVWIDHDEVNIHLGPWTADPRSGRDEDVAWDTEGFGSPAVHSGDFDEDGTPELVFVQRDGVYLLPASGGGSASSSGAPHLAMRDGDGLSRVFLAVSDTDNDGAADLLVGDWNTAPSGDVWVILGPIAGTIELDDADARVSGAGGDRLGSGVVFGSPADILAGASGPGEVRIWSLPE